MLEMLLWILCVLIQKIIGFKSAPIIALQEKSSLIPEISH